MKFLVQGGGGVSVLGFWKRGGAEVPIDKFYGRKGICRINSPDSLANGRKVLLFFSTPWGLSRIYRKSLEIKPSQKTLSSEPNQP